MKQYLELLKIIKEKGSYKEPARENMPGTYSLFGYQFRHNLQEGFPLLTTKKVSFNNIFEDEKGNAFFRCYPEMSTIDIWNEDVMQIAERRYKEIYQGEKELFGYFQNAV